LKIFALKENCQRIQVETDGVLLWGQENKPDAATSKSGLERDKRDERILQVEY
jgi:hypothetical protein